MLFAHDSFSHSQGLWNEYAISGDSVIYSQGQKRYSRSTGDPQWAQFGSIWSNTRTLQVGDTFELEFSLDNAPGTICGFFVDKDTSPPVLGWGGTGFGIVVALNDVYGSDPIRNTSLPPMNHLGHALTSGEKYKARLTILGNGDLSCYVTGGDLASPFWAGDVDGEFDGEPGRFVYHQYSTPTVRLYDFKGRDISG